MSSLYLIDSTDDCSGNSCAAGSTCVDGLNEYTCTCADGYEGQHCDTNIDECARYDVYLYD